MNNKLGEYYWWGGKRWKVKWEGKTGDQEKYNADSQMQVSYFVKMCHDHRSLVEGSLSLLLHSRCGTQDLECRTFTLGHRTITFPVRRNIFPWQGINWNPQHNLDRHSRILDNCETFGLTIAMHMPLSGQSLGWVQTSLVFSLFSKMVTRPRCDGANVSRKQA